MGTRRFRASDAGKVSGLIRRCLVEVNSKDYPIESIEKMCKHYTSENLVRISTKHETYVYVENDEILGTACLVHNWIQTVFVNPDFHGKGIGTKLMARLEKLIKERGHKTVIVPSSITAYGFYRKLGYKKRKAIHEEDFGKNIIMEKRFS